MKSLIILAVLIAGLAILIRILKKLSGSVRDSESWPYYTKTPLSQPEQILYHRLVAALPENVILAQVQLSRILGVKKGANFHSWNNRINRMSVDYLICSKGFSVIAAIELDDRSHEKTSRVEADSKKEKALASAGVPLIRWNVIDLPDEKSIREVFTLRIRSATKKELSATTE